jgi:UDP-2-acetamido-3-amino-2,3-dideoxy-glucuronate N-acetyltransferase
VRLPEEKPHIVMSTLTAIRNAGASTASFGADVFIHPQALVETTNIGPGTRVWAFAHVMEGARVGAGANICDHVFIESGAVVGDRVTIKNGVAIWDRVTIEDDVFLGPNCVLTNDFNPRAATRKPRSELAQTHIGAHATIGANATIVCGVRIGRGAFIGAGTVVIRDVPAFALVVGNPARQTGWMCLCATKLRLPVSSPPGMNTVCAACGREFTVTGQGLALHAAPVSISLEAQ